MNIAIISGGKAPSENLLKSYLNKVDYIIGVDKGNECLIKYNITPDLSLGDFDSINPESLKKIKSMDIKILKFPPEKDYTDTEIAIMEAMKKDPKKIYLFGGTGTRYDHSLGNLGLLKKVKDNGSSLKIIDDNNKMYLAKNDMILFGEEGKNISFHALSDIVVNFKIEGAKYNLEPYNMHLLDPRAICNEFLNTPIHISFESGELLILESID